MKSNIVNQQWLKYSATIYGAMSVSKEQYIETKKTFFAAFAGGLRYIANHMDSQTSDEAGAAVVQSIFEEVNTFFQEEIKRHG
jgi:hypothetical protein